MFDVVCDGDGIRDGSSTWTGDIADELAIDALGEAAAARVFRDVSMENHAKNTQECVCQNVCVSKCVYCVYCVSVCVSQSLTMRLLQNASHTSETDFQVP